MQSYGIKRGKKQKKDMSPSKGDQAVNLS